MFEHLNWLIFDVVAAVSALVGFYAVVWIWMGQPQQVSDDGERRALHALYALTAAACVEACSVALTLWLPADVQQGYVSGVRVLYVLTLVEYGVAVVILGIALIAVGRVRSNFAHGVRMWVWTLLSINLIGGALFLISEIKT